MRRAIAALVCVVMVGSGGAPASPTAASSTYAGAHVTVEVSSNAVTEYAVEGETVLSEVTVQSQEKAESSGLVTARTSLAATTHVQGAGLSVDSETEAMLRVTTSGSASMTAHDNGHGVLVVRSGDRSQYVVANLSEGASATAESDSEVTVTTESGTEGQRLTARHPTAGT